MDMLVWAFVAVAALFVELATTAVVSVWFFFGALAAMAGLALGFPFWAQALVCCAVSGFCLGVFAVTWRDRVRPRRTPTNADRNVGRVVLVLETVNNLGDSGAVKLDGQEWSARTESDDDVIESGTRVRVVRVRGSRVIVERA